MIQRFAALAATSAILASASFAAAQTVIDFEDQVEGFLGDPWSIQGLTFHDLNTVSGVFPDGSTFDPEPNDECVCEDATLWYNDFPGWGSADKLLTFANAYVPGDNLSLGRVSTVTIDLDQAADSVSMDVGYYENGPWGGIVVHLDALSNGHVVASDSFEIADGGGRDNGATAVLSVSGAEFDQLVLYSTYGNEYSFPRIILDDITINWATGGPTLTVDPLVGGQPGSFHITGAAPNTRTYLAYSLRGPGRTFVPFLNVTLDLAQPQQAGNARTTDGSGAVNWTLPIPTNGSGRTVWFQGAQNGSTTNVVTTQIR